MKASENGHLEVVGILLEHQADVNIVDKMGDSAISLAKLRRRTQIENLLLKHGATPPPARRNKISSDRFTQLNETLGKGPGAKVTGSLTAD